MTEAKGTRGSTKRGTTASAEFADKAEEALDAMETAGRETMEATAKAGKETVSEAFEKASALGARNVEKSTEAYGTMVAENRKNLDAVMAATAAMFNGLSSCNAKFVDNLKSNMRANLAYFDKLADAKGPQEVAAIQGEAFAVAMRQNSAQAMEMGMNLAETYTQSALPLKARFDEAVSTFSKPGA